MSAISEALGPLPQQFVVLEHTVPFTVALDVFLLCAANPLRWALLIGPPLSSSSGGPLQSWISPNRNTVANIAGLPIGGNSPVFCVNFRDYGILVQQPWYGSSGGSTPGTAWEIIEVLIQQ